MSPTRGNRKRLRGLASSLVPDRLLEARFRHTLARTHGVAVQHESGRQVSGTTFGRHCRLTTPVYVVNSFIGDRSYVEPYTRISNAQVGKFSAIGPACHVGLAQHPSSGYVSTHPVFYRHSPGRGFDFTSRDLREELPTTVVGNDVWIGASVCVKAGVHISDGAVIGAGAVVTRDVPPYAVCAGVPARVLRYRFDEGTVALLRAARWWDRDEDWLREHRAAFEDVTDFLQLVESVAPVDADPLPPP